MWKPKEVVPEHRWRARVVWASILLAITSYTIWQAWSIYDGYQNPSTSLEVTDETYEFPYVLVCFFQSEGCGWADGSMEACVDTALELSTVLDHEGDERKDVIVGTEYSNCIGFDLTKLGMVDDEVPPDEAQCVIDMEWVVTDIASEEVEYFERIHIYLTDSEPTEETLSFLPVPYSRVVPNDEATLPLTLADLTIGKTTKENLDGEVATTYPPLILSSTVFTANNTLTPEPGYDYAIGQMNIYITQGYFSLTTVKELSDELMTSWMVTESCGVVSPALIADLGSPSLHGADKGAPRRADTQYKYKKCYSHDGLPRAAMSRRGAPVGAALRSEPRPLDLGDFFGNIGGFWELLIVLWGLFFIASRADDTPQLKAREFIQPVKSIIRRRSLSVDSGISGSTAEERPHWEAAYRGSHSTSNAPPPLSPRGRATMARGAAAATGLPIVAQVNNGSIGENQGRQSKGPEVSSASSRRPVVQDFPRRSFLSKADLSTPSSPGLAHPSPPPSYHDMTRAA
eukprot:g9579.t4